MRVERPELSASRTCLACGGQGFLTTGNFPDRVQTKCATCGGCGRIYLTPVATREISKTRGAFGAVGNMGKR